MKARLIACAILVELTIHAARGDLPRTPVRAVPIVDGRPIERFVLTEPLYIDRSKPGVPFRNTFMVLMEPSTFIPVTEDADGFFYQSVNHYRRVRHYAVVPGGLYVSKGQSGHIWIYVGNAQMSSKSGVEKDTAPLPANILRHLKVGKAEH